VAEPSRFRRWVDRVNAPPPDDGEQHVPYDQEYLDARPPDAMTTASARQ
jgi:hypothetical protein